MKPPLGYVAYEHDGGTVHGIDIMDGGLPVWRTTPVCGAATGVSSDADGALQMADATVREITCRDCIGILDTGDDEPYEDEEYDMSDPYDKEYDVP